MSMKNSQALTLISHHLCPYVQRAVIALEEKGLPYNRINIDLNNKPNWFLKLSPLGKVPVLVTEDKTVLFESAVVAEFINDMTGQTLLSTDITEKAKQRAWIEFSSAILANIGQLYNAKNKDDFTLRELQLNAKFDQLDRLLTHSPFFAGDQFSLVDAAFAPAFRYFDVFEMLVSFSGLSALTKVTQWRNRLAGRASVQKAVSSDYAERLMDFLAKRSSYMGDMAKDYQKNQAA